LGNCLTNRSFAKKKRGDYLIVGIHGDATVNRVHGMNLPIMNLHERVLSVLGCTYVNDVLIDAQFKISMEMVVSLNISEVIGTHDEDIGDIEHAAREDRFQCAKDAGVLHMLDLPSKFSMGRILERIQRNQDAYQAKFERKVAAERQFYRQKYGNQNYENDAS
jgi:ethanolamine-phosphate cytidylyltransferase